MPDSTHHRAVGPVPPAAAGVRVAGDESELTRVAGWCERVGYRAALDYGVTVTRTTNLLAATVRAGWWSADEAWSAYMALVAGVRSGGQELRLGPIPWSGRPSFASLCAVDSFDNPNP